MGWCVYNVALIPQCGDKTCWYAAAQMLVRWCRESRGRSCAAGGVIDSPESNHAVCALNGGLSPASVYQFARTSRFNTTAMSVTSDGIADLLALRGPLWYAGMNNGFGGNTTRGHCVLIRGVSGDTLYINNPWPVGTGQQLEMDHNTFFQQLTAIANVPFLHI